MVGLYFYDNNQASAGGIVLDFSSPPRFNLNSCTASRLTFHTALPSDSHKVWKITLTRNSGVRDVDIHCNDVEVVKFSMEDGTCGYSNSEKWRNEWGRDVVSVVFQTWDTASDGYRAAPSKYISEVRS